MTNYIPELLAALATIAWMTERILEARKAAKRRERHAQWALQLRALDETEARARVRAGMYETRGN